MEKSLLAQDLDGSDGWGCVNPDGSKSTLCSGYNKNGITDFKTTTAMPAPANTIIFQESLQLQKVSAIRPNLRNTTVGYATFDNAVLSYVYNMGGDFGWADGHAKYSQKSKIHFSDFGAMGLCVPDGSGVIPGYVPGGGMDATQISMQPTKPDTGGSSFDDHDITCLNTQF